MNANKVILVGLVVLWLVSACTPTREPTPIPSASITVTKIVENDLVTGNIFQTKVFDQCHAATPIRAQVQFSDSATDTNQKAITLSEGATVEVGLSDIAKVELTGELQEHFSRTLSADRSHAESVSIEVPAQTKQEYTIVWQETRREGTIEYLENGEKKFANYSYRIGVEVISSVGRDVSCFETPSPTPPPTETPTPIPSEPATVVVAVPTSTPRPKTLAEGCIYSGLWKADSTDNPTLKGIVAGPDGCYLLGALGFSPDQAGVLKMAQVASKKAIASGIYLPVGETSVVQFKIHVNYIYLIYAEPATYINFAIAPASDPMASRDSARFRLYVDKNDKEPLISFYLADVGENTGGRIESQHYEYGRTYTIRFELAGSSMRVFINNVDMNETLVIPSGQKVFYIGYNLPTLAGVDAEISDVRVDGVLK